MSSRSSLGHREPPAAALAAGAFALGAGGQAAQPTRDRLPGLQQPQKDAAVTVLGALDAIEVLAHPPGAPAVIARDLGDVVPVALVRIHRDHGVVRGAAAERRGARIEDARRAGIPGIAPVVLRIALRPVVVGIVLDVELPAEARVLGRQAVECRHRIMVVDPVAAGIDQQHAEALERQVRRKRAAAGAGAHDDEVVRLVCGHAMPPDGGSAGAGRVPAHSKVS